MLKWLNTVVGASAPTDEAGRWIVKLNELLKPLDDQPTAKARRDLREDVLRYVAEGEPLSVLSEIKDHEAVGSVVQWTSYAVQKRPETEALYSQLASAPTALVLRWGRILETLSSSRARQFALAMPDGSRWAEALLIHAAFRQLGTWTSEQRAASGISMTLLEALLIEAGLPPSTLMRAAFQGLPVAYSYANGLPQIRKIPDFADALDRHVEVVRPLLLETAVDKRLHMLSLLSLGRDETLARLASEIVAEAVSASKQARSAATLLVRRCGDAAVGPLREMAIHGKPDQRVNALRSLWVIAGERSDDSLKEWLCTTASNDKAPSVVALLKEWTAETQASTDSTEQLAVVSPEIHWEVVVTPELKRALDEFVGFVNTRIEKTNQQKREHHAKGLAQGRNWPIHLLDRMSSHDHNALITYLSASTPQLEARSKNTLPPFLMREAVLRLAASTAVSPVALYKVLHFVGHAQDQNQRLFFNTPEAFNVMHRTRKVPSLLELSVMHEQAGGSAESLLSNYCSSWGGALARDWATEAVWPYFAQHLESLVRTLLDGGPKNWEFDRTGLFRAVATLPVPPAQVVNAMFDLALGSGKTDRPHAQAALSNLPDKEIRIINALEDGKSEVRTVAAQWLQRLHHEAAIPALEIAVAREKHDVAKGAMLDALQAMGQPVEKYLDRAGLARDAAKGLAKELPKDLEWFPWAALPTVRWSDSREPVSSEVLRWLIVQACKQKSPEPNAPLRKYCSMFEPSDREVLGQFVLDGWLRADVAPISPDVARQRAEQMAQSTFNSMHKYPQHYQGSPWLGKSVPELVAAYLPNQLRTPKGSEIASKGVLAVAAACASQRAAPPVARFLKEWYGTRAAQGKALIAMLAWIEHPSATQLMLSIGSRFRTKSFQEEATRQAEALAERKNWTLAELADRTIPSGGFDSAGELELSYGERSFTARLLPDFKVELFNPDGKKIAALSEPRQDDDAERAKEAKKAFSAAKKEIKGIVELQSARLYEALCTSRDWSFDDWNRYLNQHAVVRRLVQRLVWVHGTGTEVQGSFRPMEDGSLTDVEDNAVELGPDVRVRVAHDSLLSKDDIARWQAHLIDYQVTPLFQQLGKGTYTLPKEKARDTQIMDFEGHLIEAFALRGRATKLGYLRGATGDGGWFDSYEKRFPTLGIQAVIQFTGNPLPEQNRTVALISLSFSRSGGSEQGHAVLSLSDVPPVLVSECYNDLRLIAAEGPGFDPDWQKKSEY